MEERAVLCFCENKNRSELTAKWIAIKVKLLKDAAFFAGRARFPANCSENQTFIKNMEIL